MGAGSSVTDQASTKIKDQSISLKTSTSLAEREEEEGRGLGWGGGGQKWGRGQNSRAACLWTEGQ